jgi:hypothetical protein
LNVVPFVQCNHPALLGNRCETCLLDDVFVSLFPVHHRDPNDNGWEDISNSIRRGQPYQIIHLLLNFNAGGGERRKTWKEEEDGHAKRQSKTKNYTVVEIVRKFEKSSIPTKKEKKKNVTL